MFTKDAAGNITMHRGDTGAVTVRGRRKTGKAWTENDRMLFTVRNGSGEIVLQRLYRLDTELGNGRAVIQFHNNDTDQLENGTYNAERRYFVNPRWEGTAPEGNCVNALTADAKIVEGDVVRVPETGQFTITLQDVYGEA